MPVFRGLSMDNPVSRKVTFYNYIWLYSCVQRIFSRGECVSMYSDGCGYRIGQFTNNCHYLVLSLLIIWFSDFWFFCSKPEVGSQEKTVFFSGAILLWYTMFCRFYFFPDFHDLFTLMVFSGISQWVWRLPLRWILFSAFMLKLAFVLFLGQSHTLWRHALE